MTIFCKSAFCRFLTSAAIILALLSGLSDLLHAENSMAPAAAQAATGVEVRVFNRTVAVLRGSYMGVPAPERAERAENVLARLLAKDGKDEVTLLPFPQGTAVMIDGIMAFILVPEDADPLRQETLPQVTATVVQAIQNVARETKEAHNTSAMLKAVALAAGSTILLATLLLVLQRLRIRIATRLTLLAHSYSERLSIGGESLIHRDRIFVLVGHGLSLLYWLITIVLFFEWLGFVLARFPYTRPWGEQMNQYLTDGVMNISKSVINSIPGILIALLIFLVAKLVTNLLGSFFERIEQGSFEIAGLDRDTVRPTRRLISAAIWLFAIAMAYPYFPGAQTAAFKGLSVLVGLMLSLGGSNLVGQAASGLILMYTRTLRPGEFIRVASNEGTVMELGMFTTRIRTGMGEELTLPNSLILGNVTKNYSRAVQGSGFVVDTTVTIGYDTPWRQVHTMLLEAAKRTEGILAQPAPRVFQIALSDFYPEYRLVCQAIPNEPTPRAEIINILHANIQDVFNEYGVQIMSPHYLSDPAEPKVVPPDRWSLPPADQ